jgi:hypothetical protein
MTQPTSYQVPAHPSGLDMRTQLNAIVAAILGDNAGPTPPTETYPGMMWGDTSAVRLKRRNNANDAWIDIGPLDDFLGDLRTQIGSAGANKVSKTGDTMTGSLTLKGPMNVMWQDNAGAWYGYVGAYGSAGAAGSGMGFVNAAFTAWNFQVGDDGQAIVRSSLTVNGAIWLNGGRLNLRQPGFYGEIAMYSSDGTAMFLRGRGSGGGMEWVNNAYNAVPATMDDGGNFSTNGQITGSTIASRGNVWASGAQMSTDGNINGSIWGGWLSTWLANNKATIGAQVQHNSGIIESAQFAAGTAYTIDFGNPWVCEGIRTNQGPTWQWLRGVWLRNQ